MSAIILLAHGSRDPRWVASIAQVQARLVALLPTTSIELAFLEFQSPDLAATVQRLEAAGVTQAQVVPLFIAAGGHVLNDLPGLLADLGQKHPGLALDLGPVVGAMPTVQQAMAEAIAHHIGTTPMRGSTD